MFINCSERIVHNPPFLGYGVCVTDIDRDGRFEFFVAGFGYPNRILAWDGQALIDRFEARLSAPDRQAIGVASADMDGDGIEEVYVLNTDTFAGPKRFGDHLFAWREGTWVDLFTLPENESAINRIAGRSVCAVDRLGRGIYGVMVANYGGSQRFYELFERDEVDDVARRIGVAVVAGGRALISLPLVSQPGLMDIFAANENGPNRLFRNRGDGTFEDIASVAGVADAGSHGRGVAALDLGEDGRFSLVAGNWKDEHRLWYQSAEGVFEDRTPPEMRRPSAVRTVIAADFDNDGFEEIFFNNIGEPNRLFRLQGGAWVRADMGDADEPDGLGTGAAVADLDGDGFLELLISHGEMDMQPLSYFRVAPNANSHLRVLPLTRYGAPARGAVVSVSAGGRTQRRVVDAGSGYLCQMEPVAHFGLGGLRSVDWVEIVWPGGARRVIESPPVNQTVRVAFPT